MSSSREGADVADDQVIVQIGRPLAEYVIAKGVEARLDKVLQVVERYSDGSLSVYPMGGGHQVRIPAWKAKRDFRSINPWDEIPRIWIPGLFIIDISEASPGLRGFHMRNRWNGFACPVVLAEDIPKLQAEWEEHVDPKEPDATCRLRKKDGVWQLYQWYEDSDDPDHGWEDQQRCDVAFNGVTYECWDIGTHSLCWNDVEHDWITSVVTAQQLPDDPYAWLVNGSCNGRQMQPVHHPPALIECWCRCSCPVCG